MSRFRRLLRWGLLAFLGVAVLGALGLGFLYFLIAPKLPDVDQLRTVELQEPLYVYSRDGRLMALFGETRRYPIDIEKVPARLKQSFIAIEDSRNGVTAAKAAGMFTIAVPNSMTAGLDLSAADLRVDSLAALELGEAIRLAGG